MPRKAVILIFFLCIYSMTIASMRLSRLDSMYQTTNDEISLKSGTWLSKSKFGKTVSKLNRTITPQKKSRLFHTEDRTKGFHILGFILGFFLGPIGIILSYFIDKEEERYNRVKWAWIGWGVSIIFVLLLYVSLIILLLSSGF